jgi:enamine deaminase RidA (YjgF/YER057c/UK114 family)|tara:strand:- start:644 stop:1111 length:468 start_codon:yes stop_codon:yes gene_type:complete
MHGNMKKRLKKLKIAIPDAPAPLANYKPYNISGKQIFISGQLPIQNNKLTFIGKLGKEVTVKQAIKAAEICIINVIAQLKKACSGDFNKVKSCLKLNVYINSSNRYAKNSEVVNSASNMLIKILGQKGKHARSAVGVNSLPMDSVLEIDAIFEIK